MIWRGGQARPLRNKKRTISSSWASSFLSNDGAKKILGVQNNTTIIMVAIFDNLAATAVSFTVAGNTGVLPFLSMFLIGIIEKQDPTILNMSGLAETILSSWIGIVFFGVMTVLEFVSMCIPLVDEVVDAIMTFIIPVISILGTLSTFGLFQETSEASQGQRQLAVADTAFLVFQVCVVVSGILLSLSVHALKMVLRLIGEGWLTYCLTVMEVFWCVCTFLVAIYIRPVAIAIAAIVIIAAVYSIKRNFFDKRNRERAVANPEQQPSTEQTPRSYGSYEPPADEAETGAEPSGTENV